MDREGPPRGHPRTRVERPSDLELGELVTRYGAPVVVREDHDTVELSDAGTGPPTRGAALVAAFDDLGRVAAVRKHGVERWMLPSGRVMGGESVEEGARREAREEAGLDVELVSMPVLLIARYDLGDGDRLERWCPVFAARAGPPRLKGTDVEEIREVAWLDGPADWWRGNWREDIMGWSATLGR